MFDISKKRHKTQDNKRITVDLFYLKQKGSLKWLNEEKRKKVKRKKEEKKEEDKKLRPPQLIGGRIVLLNLSLVCVFNTL